MDTFKAIVLSPNAKADTALVNIQGKLDKLRQDLERLRSENEILTRERDEAVIDLGYFKNETQRLEHQLIEALAPKDTENTFSKMRGMRSIVPYIGCFLINPSHRKYQPNCH